MLENNDFPTIAVWFSCGAASAIAAQETIRQYGDTHNIRIVNSPIKEEDKDNQRFLKDIESWLNHPIEFAYSKRYPSQSAKDVWEDRQYMGNTQGAPCTIELKKVARQDWEKANPVDYHVLGFVLEEQNRHKRFILTERENVLPVLIDAGISKKDCYERLIKSGIKLPRIYDQGYPNANCIGCVKATSRTYWNHVREKHPDVFWDRAKQSRQLGAKLTRMPLKDFPYAYKDDYGYWWHTKTGECFTKEIFDENGNVIDLKTPYRIRIFLDELPPDSKGWAIKSMDVECGVFCEEKPNDNNSNYNDDGDDDN